MNAVLNFCTALLKKENFMNTKPFSNSPTVTVLSNRGLTIRDIAYYRHPG